MLKTKNGVGLILALLVMIIALQSAMNPFRVSLAGVDTSVFHYIASVMDQGGLIYRDTFDHKGPLLYLINYIGFKLSYYSGTWVIEVVFLYIWALLTYRISRIFAGRSSSLFVVFCTATVYLQCYFGGNLPEVYSLTFITAALYIFTEYFIRNRISSARLILCGLFFASCLMLKPNTISVWVVFAIAVLIQKIKQNKTRDIIPFLVFFIFGMMLVILPVILYLSKNHLVEDWLDCYWLFNLRYSDSQGMKAVIKVAYKFTKSYLVIPCLFIIGYGLWKKEIKGIFWYASICYILLSLYMSSMSGNAYIYYPIPMIASFVTPLAYVMGKMESDNSRMIELILILFVTIFSMAWMDSAKHAAKVLLKPTSVIELGDEEHQELFRLIEENLQPDEPFIVYGNEDSFYYYSHRFAASRYSFQYPVILMNEDIREEFFREIEVNKPRLILVQSAWCWDEYIEHFLQNHPYECIASMDTYELYRYCD